jgi:hypothetical protein
MLWHNVKNKVEEAEYKKLEAKKLKSHSIRKRK